MKKFLISLAVCFVVFILAWAIFITCVYFNNLESQNNQLDNSNEIVEYIENGNNQYLLKQLNSLIEQKQSLSVELNEVKLSLENEQNKNIQNQQKISEQEQRISDLENLVISLNNEITRLNGLMASYDEWQNGTYEIDFYDGAILLNAIAIPKNSKINTAPVIEEDDERVFKGWALSNDSEEIIEDITQLEITENTSLYAKFYYWQIGSCFVNENNFGTSTTLTYDIYEECQDFRVEISNFRILYNCYNDVENGIHDYSIFHYTTNGWENTNYYNDYDYELPSSNYKDIVVRNNQNTVLVGYWGDFSVSFELNSNFGATNNYLTLSISVEDARYLEGVSNYSLFSVIDCKVMILK